MSNFMIFPAPTGVTVKPLMQSMINYTCDDDDAGYQRISVTIPVSCVVSH